MLLNACWLNHLRMISIFAVLLILEIFPFSNLYGITGELITLQELPPLSKKLLSSL